MSRTRVVVCSILALIGSVEPVAAQGARWTLKETLRIGGAESGPTSFVSVRSMDVDSKGRILVMDRATQDIKMFAPDGKYVRTIGRKGSGPGEMKNAEGMIIAHDGRIWVRDAANARFTVFTPEGEFDKNWTTRFCWSQGTWNPQVDRQKGRIIDYDCMIVAGRGREYAVLGYRSDLATIDTLYTRPECGTRELSEAGTWIKRSEKSTMYVSIPFAPSPIGMLGPAGEMWCAPNSSRYEVQRLVAGAKDTVRFTRNVPAVPVTKAERDSIIQRYDEKGPSGFEFDRIPKTKPAIDRITIDDQGRPWIRRTNAQGLVTFDVYDRAGKPVASVDLSAAITETGPINSPMHMPFVVRGDHVYMVVLDDDDVQHVVRYQIGR
jgi:hypothetical protein